MNTGTYIVFGIFISIFWLILGYIVFNGILKLSLPRNTKQKFVACIMMGPIVVLILVADTFLNSIKKFYNS